MTADSPSMSQTSPQPPPLLARLGTLITLHRLYGIFYIGYHRPSSSSCYKNDAALKTALLCVGFWCVSFASAVNLMISCIQLTAWSELFTLPGATLLGRTIGTSQSLLTAGKFFFGITYLSLPYTGRAMSEMDSGAEHVMREMVLLSQSDRLMKFLWNWMVVFYGTILTVVLSNMVCSALQYDYFGIKEIHSEIGFPIMDFALIGHLVYFCVLYGKTFRLLGEVLTGSGQVVFQERVYQLFVTVHRHLDLVGSILGPLITGVVCVISVLCIQNIYLMLQMLVYLTRNPFTSQMWVPTLGLVYNLITHTVFLFMACLSVDYLRESRDAFFATLQDHSDRPAVADQLRRYNELLCRQVTFSGCGFFELNKRFILTVWGMALTYSVILCQSDNTE